MDNPSLIYLMALQKVNDALLQGLKACVFILENERDLTPKKRESLIASVKELIAQGEEAYQNLPEKD
jgi:hypothetical protein